MNRPGQIVLVPPLELLHVTSGFGPRTHPITKVPRTPHLGVDLRASTGTPVYAAASGGVTRSYTSDSYGERIVLSHPGGYETSYAHLSERLVRDGEEVRPGQMIGRAGNTGHSAGSHLHFELRFHGSPMDPMPLLQRGA